MVSLLEHLELEVREHSAETSRDRSGTFDDPFGHRWNVASHVEDVPADEMERRAAEAMSQG